PLPLNLSKGVIVRATLPWLGTLFCVGVLTGLTRAEYPFYRPALPAPDACGPGYYAPNHCGAIYGPNYCLQPCFPPFNGVRPQLGKDGRPVPRGRPGYSQFGAPCEEVPGMPTFIAH